MLLRHAGYKMFRRHALLPPAMLAVYCYHSAAAIFTPRAMRHACRLPVMLLPADATYVTLAAVDKAIRSPDKINRIQVANMGGTRRTISHEARRLLAALLRALLLV